MRRVRRADKWEVLELERRRREKRRRTIRISFFGDLATKRRTDQLVS